MVRRRLRQAFVVSSGQLTGILSARDILDYRARTAGNGGWWHAPVEKAMQRAPATAGPDEALDVAMQRLSASTSDVLPVVERGLLVGVLSATDILDAELRPVVEPEPLVAADAMSEPVITVRPTDALLDAVSLMVDHQFRHLPVVEDGEPVGILSDRDVRTAVGDPVRFLEASAAGPPALSVRDVMTRTAVTVPSDRPLSELASQLVDDRVGALPVIDPDGHVVGIVSYVDVLRAMAA
jgi:acetoin utilization protein AcuB